MLLVVNIATLANIQGCEHAPAATAIAGRMGLGWARHVRGPFPMVPGSTTPEAPWNLQHTRRRQFSGHVDQTQVVFRSWACLRGGSTPDWWRRIRGCQECTADGERMQDATIVMRMNVLLMVRLER